MANAFQPGDVVMLKSGGPPMTIDEVPSGTSAHYHCRWFKGATAEHSYYREHSLEKYVPPAKKI